MYSIGEKSNFREIIIFRGKKRFRFFSLHIKSLIKKNKYAYNNLSS